MNEREAACGDNRLIILTSVLKIAVFTILGLRVLPMWGKCFNVFGKAGKSFFSIRISTNLLTGFAFVVLRSKMRKSIP